MDFTGARDDGGGSGISWTISKSFAPHSRQITMEKLIPQLNFKLEMWANAQRDGRPAQYR